MDQDWYEQCALRFGGYRKLWNSTIEGADGEVAFTAWLRSTIPSYPRVLDIGCGDGLYTLHMSALAQQITGIEMAPSMIDLARRNQQSAAITNVTFVLQNAREPLPFPDGSLDLVYSRRGASSHLPDAYRALRRGGRVAGIHSGGQETILGRIEAAGFHLLRNEEFDGVEILPTVMDYALYLSRIPGFPDYTQPALSEELAARASECRTDRGYEVPFWRFIWVAVKE